MSNDDVGYDAFIVTLHCEIRMMNLKFLSSLCCHKPSWLSVELNSAGISQKFCTRFIRSPQMHRKGDDEQRHLFGHKHKWWHSMNFDDDVLRLATWQKRNHRENVAGKSSADESRTEEVFSLGWAACSLSWLVVWLRFRSSKQTQKCTSVLAHVIPKMTWSCTMIVALNWHWCKHKTEVLLMVEMNDDISRSPEILDRERFSSSAPLPIPERTNQNSFVVRLRLMRITMKIEIQLVLSWSARETSRTQFRSCKLDWWRRTC